MNSTQKSLNELTQQCSKVSRACSKILAWGLEGIDPVTGKTNRELLESELGGVQKVIEILVDTKLLTKR
jgi:hypothetical protein|tara:strand:- start:265 stop:471 length:207 start_codon:yes stop_codon:yes gene_type:complete